VRPNFQMIGSIKSLSDLCQKLEIYSISGKIVTPSDLQVYLGHHFDGIRVKKEQIVRAAQIIVHKKYSPKNIAFDLALIRLADPVFYGATIRPVRLPTREWPSKVGQCYSIGWGKYSGISNLQKIHRIGT